MNACKVRWKKRERTSCFLSLHFLIFKSTKYHLANDNDMRSFPRTKVAVGWSPGNSIRPSQIVVAIRFGKATLCAWADRKTIHKA